MFISSSKAATGSFGHVLQNGKGLLPQFTTGSSIFIGQNAGASDDGSNNRNIGIGKNALDAATTGQLNIAIGDDALTDVTTGNYNVAIGFESQKDTTGGQNTSIGYNSLEFNTSGNNNVAIGYAAAGGFTYSGISNIAIGYSALGGASVSGDYNIAIGHSVMGSITTADDNLAIGDFALTTIQTATRNVAIGSEALRYIADGGLGYNNTALGWNAGKRYGDNAGNLVSASYSVFIGHTTYPLENNSNNEILIGSQVRGKGSNTATIGDGNITDIYLSQDQGATVHTGNVSGSATSTGSFGQLVIDGTAPVGNFIKGNTTIGTSTTYNGFPLNVGGNIYAVSGDLYVNDNFGIRNASDSDVRIRFSSTNGITMGNAAGNTILHVVDTTISGSSTSTGSFGAGVISSKLGIGTNAPNRSLTIVSSESAAINLDSSNNSFIHIDRGAVNDISEIAFRTDGSNIFSMGLGNSSNIGDGTDFFIGTGSGGSGNVRFLINSSGKIGIGTTSPESILHIADGSSGAIGAKLIIDNNASDASGNGTEISFFNAAGASAAGVANSRIRSVASGNTNGYSQLQFWTYHASEAQRMVITSTGNVGIGTTDPSNYDSSADNLVIRQASGHGGITIVTDASSYGILSFGDGTGAASYRGLISYLHSADSMQFQTAGIERMKLDSSGILKNMAGVSGSAASTGSFGQGLFQGRVGIGTNNPDIAATSLDQFMVGYPGVGVASTSTNHAGIVIGTGNTHIGRIAFLDTPSAFGGAIDYHHAAGAGGVDTLKFYTDGYTERLALEGNLISGSASSTGSFGNVFVKDEIEITDSNTRIYEGNGNSVRLQTDNGYIEFGPQNAALAHIYTDKSNGFFFNRAIGVLNNKIYMGDFGAEVITLDPDTSGGSPKISGSAASTGSFGSAHIAHKVGIGTTGPGTVLPSGWSGNRLLEIRASSSGGDAGLFLRRFEGDGTYGMDLWTDTNAADSYIDQRGGVAGSQLYIRTATHTGAVNAAIFDHLGNVEFPSATTISGSASSTGSFGVLQLAKYNQGIGDAGSTIFGLDAGRDIMSGTENTAIGSQALTDITSGAGNTAVGREAGANITSGGDNVAIGKLALYTATSPAFNVAIGNEALRLTNTGGSNVGVGRESGYSGTTHSGSVYIGEQAGYGAATGNENIAVGHNAMGGGTIAGDRNIAIGVNSGDALTSGKQNVLLGGEAGGAINSGYLNTVIGHEAGKAITSGIANTILGWQAGLALQTGHNNVFIGREAGKGVTTTVQNIIAIGHGSAVGVMTTAANGSVFLGASAGAAVTSGAANVAVGYQAGKNLTDGGNNVLIGQDANSAGGTAASQNIGIGVNALLNAEGSNNVAIGYAAGDLITTGNQNILIGRSTDVSANSGANQTVIGYNATGQGDDTVVLGNSSVTDIYMSEDAGATVRAGSVITSGNVSGSATSTGSFGNVFVGKGGSAFGNTKLAVIDNNSTEYAPMGGSSNTANAMVQIHNTNSSATAPHSLIHFRLDKSGGDGYVGFMTSTSTGNIEHFVVGNQVDGEIIRGASGGNVGIGDSNPSGKLVVSGSGTINLHIDNSGTGDTGLLGKRNATSIFGMFDDASDSKLRIVNYQAEPIEFSVDRGGSETIVMTMLNSGNVGIGETSPSFPLDVVKSGNTGDPLTQAIAYQLGIRNSSSNTGAATSIAFGHETFDFSAFISAIRTSSGNHPTADLTFGTRPSDNATFVEHMRISSDGNVGIGTTSPGVALEVRDATANNGHIGGKINVAGDWNESNIAYGGNRSPGVTIQSLDSTAGTFGTLSFMNASGYTGATIIAKHVLHGAGTGNMDTQLHFGTRGIHNANSGAHNVSAMMINEDGEVGIGTDDPGATLDIVGPSDGINLRLSDVTGNSTTKEARIGLRHYTAAEEDTALMYAQSDNGTSAVYIGGGTGVMNAVELIGFVTAATDTTLSGTTRLTIDSSGNVEPGADNSYNLGAADKRWANIFSADLQLSNEGTEGNEVDGTTGSWTIQEGEDDLYLLNRKNGKKYKFKLEEIT